MRGHRQTDEVSIARGIPVPVAPGGRRRQLAVDRASSRRSATRRPDPGSTATACRCRSGGRTRCSWAACSRGRRQSAPTAGSRDAASARRPRRPGRNRAAAAACDRRRTMMTTFGRRANQQLAPEPEVVEAVRVLSGRRVLDEAVARRARERQPARHASRPSGPDTEAFAWKNSIAAVAQLDVDSGVKRRLAARHVDRAGGRVLAEQRALRPAQHLDRARRRGSRAWRPPAARRRRRRCRGRRRARCRRW